MKLKAILLSSLAIAAFAHAGEDFEQKPHSYPEYNQRFLKDQLAPILKPGKVFYVELGGKADAPGTKDAPFGSLEAARDAIRELKKSGGLPKGGVHVILEDGNYHTTKTFKLSKEDSGTKEAPIVYRGAGADKVQISGGKPIDTSTAAIVADEATLARIKLSAHGKVVSIDVPADAAKYFPGDGKYGLISLDGHLLTLAQWPNRGYNHIDKIFDKGPSTRMLPPGVKPAAYSKENPTGAKFTFREKLSPMVQAEFERSGDMRGQGYFHNDWYFQHEPIGKIDGDMVQLLRYTRYGVINKINSLPRRIRLVNVLAELDEQGEWYFDKIDSKLYIWPTAGFDPETSNLFALGGPTLVELKNTSYITLRGMAFENSGQQALSISNGEYNLLAACSVRNGLYRGASINGGKHNGITGCDFYNLEGAFSISGGNARTLERCYNFASNNDIHSCRRKGYGMIGLRGVGIYFGHNVLHDMNGAVSFQSIDCLLEYNEFYNIGYEMGDFNVAYCGALWYMMNNVVRYNFVHHLLEPGGHPVCGFRNDDGGAGLKMYGNVFYRPGRGAGQFAGPLNDFQNNITMNCNIMWWTNKRSITPEGIAAAWKGLEKFGTELPQGDKGDNIFLMEKLLGKEGWKKSPWIDEFPELAEVIELNPFAQTYGNVDLNYIYNVREPFHIHGGGGDIAGMEDDRVGEYIDLPKEGSFVTPSQISLDSFVDVPSLNFNFVEGFKPMPNFKPIPFDGIGFVADEFRPNPPNKAAYRKAVYNKFKNDRGGRYNAAKVNARYPEPSYLQ